MVELSLIVLTDRLQAAMPLLDLTKSCLDGGARTFILREKDLPRPQRLDLAHKMRELGAYVIAAGPDPLDGDAVHLAASDPVVGATLTGRSCHDHAELMASKEDYVTLSPVYSSLSKPGYGPPLGHGLYQARKNTIALGGVETPDRARECREAGAAGVAVMGAIMRAANPATVVKGLIA